MPFLFLSPSTQEFNPYITEGNEEYWMNLLADQMEPYLHASGVNTTRNDPSAGAAGAIRLSASVQTAGGALNLRGLPSTEGPILAQMPNGAPVRILASYDDWYSVFYDGLYGFAERQYIAPDN